MQTSIALLTVSLLLLLPAFTQMGLANSIEGRIAMEGVPQTRVEAWIRLTRFGRPIAQTATFRAGDFGFYGIGSGRYTIQAEAPGFVTVSVDVDVWEFDERSYVFVDMKRAGPAKAGMSHTVSVAEFLIPKEARKEFERALKQQNQSQCEDALTHLEKAVSLYSQYAAAYNEMGNCYVRLGKMDRAEDAFKTAVKLASSIYPAMNLADLYVKQLRFEEARSVLYAAVESYPGEGDAYYALAIAYFSEGRIEEAERVAVEADSRKHRIADLHLLFAKLALRRGDAALLVKHLELYLKEAPNGAYAKEVRSQLFSAR